MYNLTRFAREKYDHFALRAHLKSLGISLRSATEPIDDTSTGKLMEGVLAAFAQFDNDVRSDRTRAGMRAALELGRWTFPAPLGYLNAPKWSNASLVHDPERWPLVRRAFEDLATGQYSKQEVIARATEAGLRSRKGLALSSQSFGQMMRNPIYVGKVERSDRGISAQGDFEPLVDEAMCSLGLSSGRVNEGFIGLTVGNGDARTLCPNPSSHTARRRSPVLLHRIRSSPAFSTDDAEPCVGTIRRCVPPAWHAGRM